MVCCGCSCNLWLGFFGFVAYFCYQKYKKLARNKPKPNFDPKEYWGKGDVKDYKEDDKLTPFTVTYKDDVIELKNCSV